LPSSLTEGRSSTWVYSTRPPVSVCGTDAARLARGFSRRCGLDPYGLGRAPAPYTPLSALSAPADLPAGTAYRVGGVASRDLAPRVPPSLSNGARRHGNLDPSSIAYGASPRLRPASPAADQHGCGTLGHAVGGIRTPLALLMPTFALPAAPPALPGRLHRRRGRSPTNGLLACGFWLVACGSWLSDEPIANNASPRANGQQRRARSAASVTGLAPVDCRCRGTVDQ
jgi:hypothetical protein